MTTQPTISSALTQLTNAILSSHDPYEDGHGSRTSTLAANLALNLGMDFTFVEHLIFAANMHDIGKIAIAENILNKMEKITDSEMDMIHGHSEHGDKILSKLPFIHPEVVPIVRGHHERWDGEGYPDHLKAFDIPIGARILSIVDVFDARTMDRPYHHALTDKEAIEYLKTESGKMFDPDILEVFIKMMEEVR